MTQEVALFGNVPLPTADTRYANVQDMADAFGSAYQKISLKGNRFRYQIGKTETVRSDPQTGAPLLFLDAIIIGASTKVNRMYFEGGYVEGEAKRPVCWSHNGETPAANVARAQGITCNACPKNAEGSAVTEDGHKKRACGFLVRLILLIPDAPFEDKVFAMDLKSLSIFGDSDVERRLFSWRDYTNAMKESGQVKDLAQVMTRFMFNDSYGVPVLYMSPLSGTAPDWYAFANTSRAAVDMDSLLGIAGGKVSDNQVQAQGVANAQANQQPPMLNTGAVHQANHGGAIPAPGLPAPTAAPQPAVNPQHSPAPQPPMAAPVASQMAPAPTPPTPMATQPAAAAQPSIPHQPAPPPSPGIQHAGGQPSVPLAAQQPAPPAPPAGPPAGAPSAPVHQAPQHPPQGAGPVAASIPVPPVGAPPAPPAPPMQPAPQPPAQPAQQVLPPGTPNVSSDAAIDALLAEAAAVTS